MTVMDYFLTVSSVIIFRKKRPPMGRIKLCAGVFGIGLIDSIKREDYSYE